MAQEPQIRGLSSDWVQLAGQNRESGDAGQDSSKLKQCRQEMKTLHLKTLEWDGDGYSFTSWVGGAMPAHGEYIGYKYFNAGHHPEREEQVPAFSPPNKAARNSMEYIAFQGPWYLYYLH